MGLVKGAMYKPICPKGHDKREVGRGKENHCLECRRQHARKVRAHQRKGHPHSVAEARYLPRLREVRERMGLSQAEFARLCGLHQAAVSNYELGKRRATPYALRRILPIVARALSEGEIV